MKFFIGEFVIFTIGHLLDIFDLPISKDLLNTEENAKPKRRNC